ncbi:flagellar motor protein MotB [Bosea sp. RAC05]|jgi:chemotaxis protein MotB|uniref:flagellar motor protein MotB n=1 Tax=unclassified Bosea (in: a-proteobacteria) TaxID=2653178 RepID=UPI00083CE07A|nr:flagellar motor protein MotB [Bosea sp. RAC05]AOG07092.1 membrane MotB of proton-channel complex MotA/MotB family protein [Bosea sp. RAC05]
MAKTDQPIIIKKVKKAAHGHHGGAWKIAYADFVTAMMAFFLLMWLISMTTKEQKIGLAEYFAPANVSPTTSGSGGVLMGTAIDKSGAKSSAPRDNAASTSGQEEGTRRTSAGRATERDVNRPASGVPANHSAAASIRQALQAMPEFAEISRNIVIEPSKDGLDVSLMDQDGRSMFPEGSVRPHDRTRLVLEALAPTLRRLPNRLAITGHTAAVRPGSARSGDPWSLTAGRALAVREILSGAGFPNDRFTSVVGRADTEPVFPDNPYLSPNRRVTITLINEAPPLPPSGLR